MTPTQKNFRKEVKEADKNKKLKGTYEEYRKTAGQSFDYNFNDRKRSAFYESNKISRNKGSIIRYLFIGWNIFALLTWVVPRGKIKINTPEMYYENKNKVDIIKPINKIKSVDDIDYIMESISSGRIYTSEYINSKKSIPTKGLVDNLIQLKGLKSNTNEVSIIDMLDNEITFLEYLIETHNQPFTEADKQYIVTFNETHKALFDNIKK